MRHKDIPPQFNHVPFSKIFVDDNERISYIPTEEDEGKLAYQIDNGTLWLMSAVHGVKIPVEIPTAQEIGADPAGTANSLLESHISDSNPHPQYLLASDINLETIRGKSIFLLLASPSYYQTWGTTFSIKKSGSGAGFVYPNRYPSPELSTINRMNFSTGTSSTGSCGIVSNFGVAWRGNAPNLGGFTFFARFGIGYISSDIRVFVGLSTYSSALTKDPTIWNYDTIGIAKSNSDTTWKVTTSDGTSNTNVDTNYPVQLGKIVDFLAIAQPNSNNVVVTVKDPVSDTVYLDNVVITTNLPKNNVFLRMQAHIQSQSGTTQKILSVNQLYCESKL